MKKHFLITIVLMVLVVAWGAANAYNIPPYTKAPGSAGRPFVVLTGLNLINGISLLAFSLRFLGQVKKRWICAFLVTPLIFFFIFLLANGYIWDVHHLY